MKKILILLLIVLMLVPTFSACTTGSGKAEIALITDIGTIDDKSFNQGAWEGLVKYAKAFDKTYKYYQPSEKTTDAYVAAITLAVDGGAKIIVTPGYLFEPAIFKAQDMYPEVSFVLLDGFPQDGTYTTFRIEKNVESIFYAEEQVGFLAGYAAVKEGFKHLGFMGGIAVPAVIRYGYGYIQGAEYAAVEMGLAKDSVELKYTYLGGFGPDPAYQTKAASWYSSGTEVIFAAAGGAGNSVMAAAEEQNGKVIGVDVDQSGESSTVIISAMKMLGDSVYTALDEFYTNKFKGGESITLDAAVGGVGFSSDFSKFKVFTKADYDALFAKLVANTDGIASNIKRDVAADGTTPVTIEELGATLIKVTVIE
jgi:basic membrane protein A and related proteins